MIFGLANMSSDMVPCVKCSVNTAFFNRLIMTNKQAGNEIIVSFPALENIEQ
jgi:hypothetical protein